MLAETHVFHAKTQRKRGDAELINQSLRLLRIFAPLRETLFA
jgi:hypothetical protein